MQLTPQADVCLQPERIFMDSNRPSSGHPRRFTPWTNQPKENACGKILPQAFLGKAGQIKQSSYFSTRFINGLGVPWPFCRRSGDQAFNTTSTSSSIFFASPNSIRLFSL
jgi:hypothetical protein